MVNKMSNFLYKSTVTSTLKMLASSFTVFVLQFASTIILTRLYSPGEFGILSKLTIVTSFADVFCQLGLGAAIVQKSECTEKDYQTVAFSSVFLGIATSLLIFAFANPISSLIHLENSFYIKLIAPAFCVISLSVLPIGRAQKEMRFNVIISKDITSYLSYLIVCVLLGTMGLGIAGLIIGLLVKYVVATTVSLIVSKYPMKMRFYKSSFFSMLKFGTGYSLCKICSVATDQSDYYAIAQTLNDVALGLYNRAFQLISTPISLIGQAFDQVFFSSFSKIKNNEKRIGELFISISSMISAVCMFGTVIIYYCSGWITLLLFGKQWIDTAVPISILSIAMFSRSSIKITDPIMRAKGYVYQRAIFHLTNTIITVIAALFGSRYGLLGVSLGVVIAQYINYFINTIYVCNKLRISYFQYCEATLPCCLLTIISCLLGYVMSFMPTVWSGKFDVICFCWFIGWITMITVAFGLVFKYVYSEKLKNEQKMFLTTLISIGTKKAKKNL